MNTGLWKMDSGLAAARRPGMTTKRCKGGFLYTRAAMTDSEPHLLVVEAIRRTLESRCYWWKSNAQHRLKYLGISRAASLENVCVRRRHAPKAGRCRSKSPSPACRRTGHRVCQRGRL